MPTDRIFVDRVDCTDLASHHQLQYLVTGTYADGRLDTFQAVIYESRSKPFRAALCQRAKEKRFEVRVQWVGAESYKRVCAVEACARENRDGSPASVTPPDVDYGTEIQERVDAINKGTMNPFTGERAKGDAA